MQIDPMITTGSPPPSEKKARKEKKLCVGRRVVGLGRRDRKLENQDRTTLETSRSDYGDSHRPSPSEETDRSNIEPQLFSDMSKWTPFFFFFFFSLIFFLFFSFRCPPSFPCALFTIWRILLCYSMSPSNNVSSLGMPISFAWKRFSFHTAINPGRGRWGISIRDF